MDFVIIKKDLWKHSGFGEGLPEVGDLQRSSVVLDPSFESQVAAGATEVVIKHYRISPLGLLSEKKAHYKS